LNSQNSPLPSRSHRPLRNVLIATSFGDESDAVVRQGIALARVAGARVFLVHAVELDLLPVGLDAGPVSDPGRIGRCEEDLRRQVERLGEGWEPAGAEVRMGTPHRVLAEMAEQTAADLIVVGATRSGSFTAELLGSTADRVLRKASCPVLVVRNGLPMPRKVLAPVDLSPVSGEAFRRGLHLLAQLSDGGEIQVRVVYALGLLDALAVRQRTGGQMPLEEVERPVAEELARFVSQNLENLPGERFQVETAVLSGEARVEILRELEERPADLVILGTHGRGGWDRLVLGSVASTVARKAPCSVLVVPPDAALAEQEER